MSQSRAQFTQTRNMTLLQVQSVCHPFDNPSLASAAITALSHADAMGLLTEPITCLNHATVRGLESCMTRAGIGQDLDADPDGLNNLDQEHLISRLDKINRALRQSPIPAWEWQSLHSILGVELLGRLLGISESSVRRYISESRATPERMAERLHYLAFIVGDLRGAYNDIGVQGWFDRNRSQLAGRTPAQALGEQWSPDDDGPRDVQELACALRSFPVS